MSNTSYKQTAVGLIPSDWEVKRLGEIADVDKMSLKSDTNPSYEFDYISLSDVDSEDFNIETSKQIFKTAPSRARRLVKKGDILMSTVRPNLQGFSIIRNNVNDLIASTGFAVISAYDCDNYFLYQYIFSNPIQKQFYSLLVGSNYPAINSSDVKLLKIPLPPLPEQLKIAAILSTWDVAIDKCKVIIEELKVRNKGLTQKLFNKEFEKKHLSEIFERVTTKNSEKNQNVITISAQRGFIKQTNFFNKVIASEVLDNYFLVKKGDFCYNKSYSNGYDWGATKRLNDFEKAVVTTLYICFRIKDVNQNSGDFFEYYFESGILYKGLSKVANEGGRAHGLLNVTSSDFFNIKIGVPTFEEQKAIANILDKATEELNQYQQKLQTLQLQKKGLMQQLLTGKVRVKI